MNQRKKSPEGWLSLAVVVGLFYPCPRMSSGEAEMILGDIVTVLDETSDLKWGENDFKK